MLARLVIGLLAVALISCSPAALTSLRPSASPSPSHALASTSSPTSTPSRTSTPTPEPTDTPAPTFTSDDTRIASMINGGVEHMKQLSDQVSNQTTLAGIFRILNRWKSYADSQAKLLNRYTPSECTNAAWQDYSSGLGLQSGALEDALAWAMAGGGGDFPTDEVSTAAQTLGQAVSDLDSTPC